MMHRTSSRVLLIVAVFVLFLVPVAAIAAGGFTDVDDDSVFKADIQWLADAGVTKGCNPPTNDKFCPEGNVTREQMAAFMHRLATNRVVDAKTAVTAQHATTADSAIVADKLDGKDSTAFASSGHDHDADYLAIACKAADADKLDGMDSTAFAVSGHDHDADYLAVDGRAADADHATNADHAVVADHAASADDASTLQGLTAAEIVAMAGGSIEYRSEAVYGVDNSNPDPVVPVIEVIPIPVGTVVTDLAATRSGDLCRPVFRRGEFIIWEPAFDGNDAIAFATGYYSDGDLNIQMYSHPTVDCRDFGIIWAGFATN